ncbi:hypothetical protein L6164_005758 [Bauhinia variegata]|uniref:Uncharacterized protein n=1 Tax=Bauhinia variegata TaxID=167791 RepID=A0ACB9PRD9_BAUVA|nr:hypothetical protein L6164_005758 [Bauhinia variegata]
MKQIDGSSIELSCSLVRPEVVFWCRTVTKEANKTGRRYSAVECDPLVLKGLERTVRNMVIPYMPMLVPPVNWTGYHKGGHLFLPFYIMRTHGSRQQREVVKRAPRKQLQPVFEVPLPEKPDTEDEALIREWKWKVRSAKKVNRERYS